MEASSPRSFWCFISYRHADNHDIGRQWATWLHQQIETYEVPSELVGTTNGRGDTIPERIFPVFRDEDELPADADLSSPIYRALDVSKFLVVLCSPRAVQSTYVAAEIAYYKKIGRSDRILAALVEGEPNASWDKGKQAAEFGPEKECFPMPLRHPVDAAGNLLENEYAEPIAADFRLVDGSQGWTSTEAYRQALHDQGGVPRKQAEHLVANYARSLELAKLKIIAGILGVSLGTLTQRDKAYQLEKARRRAAIFRRVAIAMGVLTLGALAAGAIAFLQKQEAERQRQAASDARDAEKVQRGEAEKRRGEAEDAQKLAENRRTEAEAARNLAEDRRVESERQLARSNVRLADRLAGEGDTDGAAAALWAIPEDKRAWEWGYLLGQAYPESARMKIFEAENGLPKAGLIDPTGKRVLAWSTEPKNEDTSYPMPEKVMLGVMQADGSLATKSYPVKESLHASAWSRDGHALVVDGEGVKVFGPDGALIAQKPIEAIMFSAGFITPDGSRFAVKRGDYGEAGWTIYALEGVAINEVASIRETFELEEFGDASADGSRWAVVTSDTGVAVYDANGKQIEKYPGMWGAKAAFAEDGSLAIATIDQAIYVKSPKKPKLIKLNDSVPTVRRNTTGVSLHWVGTNLWVRHVDGVRGYDLAKAEPGNSGYFFEEHGEEVSLEMAASEHWVAIGLLRGTIVIFDPESMREVARLHGHAGEISSLTFVRDGLLASTGQDGTLRYWDLKPRIRFQSTVNDPPERPADDVFRMASYVEAPSASESSAPASPGRPYLTRVRLESPDKTRAATGGNDGQVRVWEPGTNTLLLTLAASSPDVEKLGFSKDGAVLGGSFMDGPEDVTSDQIWVGEPWTRERLGIPADTDWKAAYETKRTSAFKELWGKK